ncbi:hypothetical protein HY387_01555, partial [Candidatus Daviesbacteria bacterium]|nr:hypothetical protein [Candidatus Daviesbacteria bacterium]
TTGTNSFSIFSQGNVGINSSAPNYTFLVNGTGYYSGFLGVGSSMNVSGNLGVGASLTVSSTGAFRLAGQTSCSSLSNGGKLTTDANGNVYCSADSTGEGESTTASNGLTLSGSDVQLGGFLTKATAIDINSQSFGFLGGNVGIGTSVSDYNFKVLGSGYFSGFLGVGTSLNVSGNAGIGQSLTVSSASVLDSLSVTKSINAASLGVSGISNLAGNVGVGASLTTTSAGVFSSGIKVSGAADLTSLSVSGISSLIGNVGVGASLTTTSAGVFSSGIKVSGTAELSGISLSGDTITDLTGSNLVNNSGALGVSSTPSFTSLTLSGNNAALTFSGTTPSITTTGTNSFSIFSQGNVGINSSAPNYTFLVNGTGYYSGFLGVGSSMNVS